MELGIKACASQLKPQLQGSCDSVVELFLDQVVPGSHGIFQGGREDVLLLNWRVRCFIVYPRFGPFDTNMHTHVSLSLSLYK